MMGCKELSDMCIKKESRDTTVKAGITGNNYFNNTMSENPDNTVCGGYDDLVWQRQREVGSSVPGGEPVQFTLPAGTHEIVLIFCFFLIRQKERMEKKEGNVFSEPRFRVRDQSKLPALDSKSIFIR